MTQTDNEADFKRILEELKGYKENDCQFSKGHILGSMCTAPHPIAKKAYNMFLEANLGDPRLFTGSKKIEQEEVSPLEKKGLRVAGILSLAYIVLIGIASIHGYNSFTLLATYLLGYFIK